MPDAKKQHSNSELMRLAVSRARTRLAHLHPEDHERLYNEERAELGLPPVNRTKRRVAVDKS